MTPLLEQLRQLYTSRQRDERGLVVPPPLVVPPTVQPEENQTPLQNIFTSRAGLLYPSRNMPAIYGGMGAANWANPGGGINVIGTNAETVPTPPPLARIPSPPMVPPVRTKSTGLRGLVRGAANIFNGIPGQVATGVGRLGEAGMNLAMKAEALPDKALGYELPEGVDLPPLPGEGTALLGGSISGSKATADKVRTGAQPQLSTSAELPPAAMKIQPNKSGPDTSGQLNYSFDGGKTTFDYAKGERAPGLKRGSYSMPGIKQEGPDLLALSKAAQAAQLQNDTAQSVYQSSDPGGEKAWETRARFMEGLKPPTSEGEKQQILVDSRKFLPYLSASDRSVREHAQKNYKILMDRLLTIGGKVPPQDMSALLAEPETK